MPSAASPRSKIFRVGVQVIEGACKADSAGPAFAAIAECVIAGLLPSASMDELSLRRAACTAVQFAVIAMGKLGGREMTAGSDLDLVFVYDAPARVEVSDGKKPMPVSSIMRGWPSG